MLVVAGAGSGKTLTICGKVLYLLKAQKVDKKDILLLSYSKNSAQDLKDKISRIEPDMAVSTFHSLGLGIINEIEQEKQNVDEQYDATIESFFRVNIFDDTKISKKFWNTILFISRMIKPTIITMKASFFLFLRKKITQP